MIFEILFILCMFLWLLTLLPFPPLQPYSAAGDWLAWFAVLFLGLHLYLGGGRLA